MGLYVYKCDYMPLFFGREVAGEHLIRTSRWIKCDMAAKAKIREMKQKDLDLILCI